MSKLLRADFARLWKGKIFYIGIAYALCVGILSSHTEYREMVSTPGYYPHADNILFGNSPFMPIAAAVFIGLFVGTEYSDGTIRNKLIIGHSRTAVYLSNLIVCLTALFIIHLTAIAAVVAVGFPLVGNVEAPIPSLFLLGGLSMATVAALTALFLLISMLVHSKANASVTAILLSIVLVVAAMSIHSRLQEPEYYDTYVYSYTDGADESEYTEQEKNPDYLSGTKRRVYEFLDDFLPSCQMLQIAGQAPTSPVRLPLYSLLIFAATTGCGCFFFRRKNLK